MESIFKELFKDYSVLDNSMKPENEPKYRSEYSKYRGSSGKYDSDADSFEKLSGAKKQAIIYESQVANYLNEL